jgi:hypothetical protein
VTEEARLATSSEEEATAGEIAVGSAGVTADETAIGSAGVTADETAVGSAGGASRARRSAVAEAADGHSR